MTTPPDAPMVLAVPPSSCPCQQRHSEEVRWFAMLVRQGLKLVVVGIERKYGIDERKDTAA